MKRLLLHTMRCFLPVLFLTYLAGVSLFTHVHVVNGVTIVHSHPFSKTHEHSSAALQTITLLSHLATDGDGVLPFVLLFIPLLFCLLPVCLKSARCYLPSRTVVALRAPPVVC